MNSAKKKSFLVAVVCLILCVALLVGTTFAWFTDSVSNTGNKIQAGTLDVQLWAAPSGASGYGELIDISDSTTPLFNYEKWEPGYSTGEQFVVKNNGNLALKYGLSFYITSESKGTHSTSTDTSLLSKVLEVYVNDVKQGTLETFVQQPFSTGAIVPAGSTAGDGEKAGQSDPVNVVIKMPESAGNEYQGASLSFDIRLVATQYAYEEDGFGSKQYDAAADETPDNVQPEKKVATTTVVAEQVASFEVTNTPSNDSAAKTNVGFTADALNAGDATLTVETYDAVETTRAQFTVQGTAVPASGVTTAGTTPVAAVGLTLDDANMTKFNESTTSTATITTYIVKNLTNVAVSGPAGVTVSNVSYEASTGKLIFTTNHFSDFVVLADLKLYNEAKQTAYNDLQAAIDDAAAGQTIDMLADLPAQLPNHYSYANQPVYTIEKNLILNGNGHKITVDTNNWSKLNDKITGNVLNVGVQIADSEKGSIDVTINDLTIKGNTAYNKHGFNEYYNGTNGVNMKLNNCSVSDCGGFGVVVQGSATIEKLSASGCGWGGIDVDHASSGASATVKNSSILNYSAVKVERGTAVIDGGTYGVISKAEIESLISNMKEGSSITIKLLADISYDGELNIAKSGVTIDGNGFEIIGNCDGTEGVFVIDSANNDLAIRNCTVTRVIKQGCTEPAYGMLVSCGTGILTADGVVFNAPVRDNPFNASPSVIEAKGGVSISNCTIATDGYGLFDNHVTTGTIKNTVFKGINDKPILGVFNSTVLSGLVFDGCTFVMGENSTVAAGNFTVKNCVIDLTQTPANGAGNGISVYSENGPVVITGNTFKLAAGKKGINLTSAGWAPGGHDGSVLTITGNTFTSGGAYAVKYNDDWTNIPTDIATTNTLNGNIVGK